MDKMDHHDSSDSNPIEYLKFVAVIVLITFISWGLYPQPGDSDGFEFIRLFMGVFLVVFSGFKLVGYQMFVMMFQGYDLIARKSKLYAQLYPFSSWRSVHYF